MSQFLCQLGGTSLSTVPAEPKAEQPSRERAPSDDSDWDGVPESVDDCPFTPNEDQADTDGNGVGDACERETIGPGDFDGDGVPDNADNCPSVANALQVDTDRDG